MLTPDPAVVADLLARYRHAGQQLQAGNASGAARRQLDDLAYSLCVITGTRNIDEALATAQQLTTGGFSRPAAA